MCFTILFTLLQYEDFNSPKKKKIAVSPATLCFFQRSSVVLFSVARLNACLSAFCIESSIEIN